MNLFVDRLIHENALAYNVYGSVHYHAATRLKSHGVIVLSEDNLRVGSVGVLSWNYSQAIFLSPPARRGGGQTKNTHPCVVCMTRFKNCYLTQKDRSLILTGFSSILVFSLR